MSRKRAFLVINPRAGQDMTKLPDAIAVLSAAGWKTDNALVEYSGHSITLATKAAEEGYDLIIAHGGDGTINDVVNGVMKSKEHQSIIGVLPGGTANQWATEIGMPLDPIKAALTLIESCTREVDLGRIEIQGLTFPASSQGDSEHGHSTKSKKNQKDEHSTSKSAHYFLLTAGLGIDASIIHNTSKLLKARLGRVAFDIAALKALPELHPFLAELQSIENKDASKTLWQGEALQIILGNTRRYADVVEFTPNALIDDGALDVCVIIEGNPLTAAKQMTSLFTRHKADNTTADYFREAHLSLTVPVSLPIQLDGSTLKLTSFLSKSDHDILNTMTDTSQVQVTYLFDAIPHTLHMAIPRTYDNTLFASAPKESTEQNQSYSSEEKEGLKHTKKAPHELHQQVNEDHTNGQSMTIVGAALSSTKKQAYVVAGNTNNQRKDEIKPVAVSIDEETTVINNTGEPISASKLLQLQEGSTIIVEGKENKRGIVQAKQVTL